MNAGWGRFGSLGSVLVSGCGGAAFDHRAGEDGWLDHEAPPTQETVEVADDGRCVWTGSPFVGVTVERAYTMRYVSEDGDCADLPASVEADEKTVWGLVPGQTVPELLIDVSGHDDVRLLDTSAGLLLMGEVDGGERLYRVDHTTLELLDQRDVAAQFWGTRTSASRRWVVVADNLDESRFPLQVIDPLTLEVAEVDPGATWLEAMWMSEREALAGVVVTEAGSRLALWDFDEQTSLVAGMPAPTIDVDVPGRFPSLLIGPTWIGVDPLDRYVVVPLNGDEEGYLEILDAATGEVREVPGALGPVAFTPDGSTIVAWDLVDDVTLLVLVDPVTLETRRVELPQPGIPSYFVSYDGNDVVVSSPFGDTELVLVDADTGDFTTLGLALSLGQFTARVGHDELWVADDGLWRVDLAQATTERMDGLQPEHVVWMPSADLLFLDDAVAPKMVFWDPNTRETVTEVRLDTAPSATARLSLRVGPRVGAL
ncbi:MAG: hypothetical protein ABMA64_14715 [Myxococcota bacterium]